MNENSNENLELRRLERLGKVVAALLEAGLTASVPEGNITFAITETAVLIEHETGKNEKFWLPDFIDALPNAPQRGKAVIETLYYGKQETECAIHTYEIRDPYTGEYDDQTHFIPLEVYLRELVSVEDMETAYLTLKSLTA